MLTQPNLRWTSIRWPLLVICFAMPPVIMWTQYANALLFLPLSPSSAVLIGNLIFLALSVATTRAWWKAPVTLRTESASMRLLRWALLLLSAAICVIWLLSGAFYIGLSDSYSYLISANGGVMVVDQTADPTRYYFNSYRGIALRLRSAFILFGVPDFGRWFFYRRPDGWTFVLPLWAALYPLVPVTALLWWRARKAPAPNSCSACNYDLTGNESGLCPECGKPVAPSRNKARN